MLARTLGYGLNGVNGFEVKVEVYLSGGMMALEVVGLPDASVKESRDRVRAAIQNSGYTMPVGRLTVNLAPADMKKEGPAFDLPIALGILMASRQLDMQDLSQVLTLGELSLDGTLHPVRGALPMVIAAKQQGITDIILPAGNAPEVSCIQDIRVYPAQSLDMVVQHLNGRAPIPAQIQRTYENFLESAQVAVDMSQVNTEDELLRAAQQYTVFGRVSPEQKRQLVQAFQDQGHRVAMTGDGVNDILAMRKADCSIAMAHGSEAARQAAQVVLLDSDFTVLPNILLEGRRVVNNMTRVAGVFFVKTIYSILLSLFCVLADLPFPLIPIQVTLIDLFIEGYPAFFQSFVPDGRALTWRFLPCVLRRSLPNAVAILLASAVLLLGGGVLGLPAGQIPLALYLVIGAVEADALLKSCLPLTSLRGFLFLTASVGFFCAVLLFHAVLSLPPLLPETVPVVLLASAGAVLAKRLCAFGLERFLRPRNADSEYLTPTCF